MYIERFIEVEIKKHIDRKEYIAIIWPRQVWKTTFIKKLKSDFPDSFYYNFEDFTIKSEFEKNTLWFIKNHIKKGKKTILFFDEFQYVENAWNKLKLIYDSFEDINIIITWSSSLHTKEIWAKMVWRILTFEMQWLSIEEILQHKNQTYYNAKKSVSNYFDIFNIEQKQFLKIKDISFPSWINQIIDEYIVWWWMPAVVTSSSLDEKQMVLSNFTQNYINKDIVNLLKVRNIDKFSNLMVTLSIIIWQQIVIDNLSNDLSINIVTINKYLNYLNQTFINKLINPYHKNNLNEIKKQKIEYFYDLWIRNYLIKNFNNLDIRWDNWYLLENYIFLRLDKLKEKYISLHYWREKNWNEVDFIIKMQNKFIPIEIKYQNIKKAELTTWMKNFNELYKDMIDYGIIITKDFLDIYSHNWKKYYFLPYYYL